MRELIVLCFILLASPLFAQGTNPMIDYTALKAELINDPMGYGYAPYLSDFNPVILAEMLNLKRAEIVLPRPDVTPLEILEAINISDFLTDKTNLWAAWFESLTQFPSVRILKTNGSDTRVMTNILKLLANGSASETRIRELAVRSGSRAEQLFGVDVTVSYQDVIDAIRNY